MGYIIGIDFGMRRVGVSISDLNKKIAFPLTVIEHKDKKNIFKKIGDLIKGKDIEKFVVGLPLRTDGKISQIQELVVDFIDDLSNKFNIEVVSWDERYTSVIAKNVLDFGNVKRKNQKKVIDKISAQLILQSYLDYLQNTEDNNL